jgi:hypothetical protein
MSAVVLLDQVQQYLRAQFTRAEVRDVLLYGGEFSAEEIPFESYSCPAILLAVLGWAPGGSSRMTGRGVRTARVAAFVAVKHAQREKRMLECMRLAERLSVAMRMWMPNCTGLPAKIAPLEDEARCENLYSRAVDKKGQALWLVDWEQAVMPTLSDAQLFDWLSVEINSTGVATEPPESAGPGGPAVTQSLALKIN